MSRDSVTIVISETVSITVENLLVSGLVLIIKSKSFEAFFSLTLGTFIS